MINLILNHILLGSRLDFRLAYAICLRTSRQILYRKCIKEHAEQTKQAMLGNGFDRHLFALSTQATVV